jgi:hypothetical protein
VTKRGMTPGEAWLLVLAGIVSAAIAIAGVFTIAGYLWAQIRWVLT